MTHYVKVDKDRWSESSKRSMAYDGDLPAYYENIAYLCGKCSQASVFTADEQKYMYEVLKQYIWQRKTLCSSCRSNLDTLRQKNKEFQRKWDEGKKVLQTDYRFLCAWLEVLEDIPAYRKKANSSMITMLTRLARECA